MMSASEGGGESWRSGRNKGGCVKSVPNADKGRGSKNSKFLGTSSLEAPLGNGGTLASLIYGDLRSCKDACLTICHIIFFCFDRPQKILGYLSKTLVMYQPYAKRLHSPDVFMPIKIILLKMRY